MPNDPKRDSIVVCLTGDGASTERALAAAGREIAAGRELVVSGVVDPGVAERIREQFPDALIVRAATPIPPAEARTRGAAAARGDRLLVVEGNRVVPAAWIDRPDDGPPAAAGGIVSWLAWTGRAGRRSAGSLARSAAPPPDHLEEGGACQARGDDDGAILHFRQALADAGERPPRALAGLANSLYRQERLDEAAELYREMAERFPLLRQGPAGIARVLQARQVWHAAHEAWKEVAERFPESPEGRLGTAAVLAKLGRFAEAEEVLAPAAARWPAEASIRIAKAGLAADVGDHRRACRHWQEAVELAPGNLGARAGWVRGLLDVIDPDTARRVFDAAEGDRLPAWYRSILADIHAATFDWAAALDVLRGIVESSPQDLAVGLREVTFLVRAAGYTCQPRHLDRAVARCESLVGRHPHSLRARVALAECLVTASRDEDAAGVIDRLPEDRTTILDVAKLKAWRRATSGDVAGAKAIWRAIERGHHLPAVHAPPGILEPADGVGIATAPGGVLLFTVIRDEAWRLPWFLEYYRRIGVDRFFIVDNGSVDGGPAFLRAQADVHLFHTTDSYAAAMSGMRWVNELVERHGDGHWCLYVDVDEMLVVPGVEDHGLRPVLETMERRDQEGLRAFMLDMHGPTAGHRPECRVGDDPLPLFPFFDATHHWFGAVECPYRQMSGGVRRHAGTTCDLTKTPIIRGGRSIRFLSSSHRTTPVAIAEVTGALLHFKRAGAPARWTTETIGDRRPGCIRRHLADTGTAGGEASDPGLIGPSTVRYESSRQLLALGLIECPAAILSDLETGEGGDGD